IQGAAVLGDGFWSRGWQDHRSSCVGGDGRDEGKRLALFDPGGSDLAADALVPRFGMGEAAAGVGLDEDLLVRRTVALDATDVLDHPLIHGAEGIVGERVHTRILEALFRGPAVPPLPDAGSSLLDRETPGGKGIVEEETIGHVMAADLGEDQHQVFGADETRREMVVVLLDILDKIACGLPRPLTVNKIDRKGQDVASLGISLDPAVAADVGIVECGLDLPVKVVETGGVLGLAEDLGGLCRKLGTEGEVGGEDDVFRSVGADAQPVSETVVPGRWEQFGRAPLAAELDELQHRGILPLEQAAVAVDLVDCPRADHARVGPGGAAVVAGHLHGSDHGKLAVGPLAVDQVDQPLIEECLDVAVERDRADVNLGIAGPPQSLVALGAVGGDVDEVGSLGPVAVAMELVEHRVGALEPAHDGRVAGKGDPGYRANRGWGLQPGDLDVLEAVKCESWRPGLLALAVADVRIDAAGGAKVCRVDGAIRAEPFGEPEGDPLAGLSVNLEPQYAGEVLAQVEHVHAGLRLCNRFGPELRKGTNGRSRMRLNQGFDLSAGDDRRPPGIVEPRFVPAINGRSRVIGFAHEEISLDDRAGRRLPVCPGRHDFGAAVGILEVQLTLEARVLAVMVALLAEADVAAVPAIRQYRAQGVVPRMNPVGHIIGAVVDPSGVVGPAGVEIIVADALAVEVKVMNSQRGGVDRGPAYGLPHRKGDSKVRRRRKNQLGGFRFCS